MPDDAGLLDPVWAGTPVHQATSDRAVLQAMIDVEAALTRAQATLGIVSSAAPYPPADAFDLDSIATRARASGNPVPPLVDDLRAAVGPHVHRGATSQDILDSALMLVVARTLPDVLADLDRVTAALAALAATHRDTPTVARTLTQHAVPTTFGLKAAGWLVAVRRAADALRTHLPPPLQLGGAGGTMAAYLFDAPPSTFHELPARIAHDLGLRVPTLPWHTDRHPVAALGAALALVTGALGKLATDVLTLSRTEIAELAEPAHGPSSAMPHKRNPAMSTLIRAAALQAPALAATLLHAQLAEDERPAGPWHAEWPPLRALLRLTAGAAHTTATLTEGLHVDPARMRTNLDLTGGAILSEHLGPARTHELLAEATRTGRPVTDLLAEPPWLELGNQPADPAQHTGAAGRLVDHVLDRERRRRQ